jgi:site-specific recombinase XerD
LGLADDLRDADGVKVLTFAQAVKLAGDWHEQRQRETASGGVYRLQDAAADWLAAWTGSEAGKAVAEANVTHWILPALGTTPINQLQTEDIQRWLEDIASKPPIRVQQRMNSAAYKQRSPSRQSKVKYDASDPETKRKRRDSANRVFNDLAAICNRAFQMRKDVTSDAAWRKVQKFDAAREKQEFLTADEVPLVLAQCEADFAKLVYGSIASGMRYMEQARMKRSTYSKVQGLGLVTMVQPKTGKIKHVYMNEIETQFFDELVKGLEHDSLVFTKADGSAWEKSNQQPRLKAVLKKAGIKRHIRWHDLRHSAASLLAAGGASLAVISKQLGHSSQRVTERYAHLIDDHVSQSVRSSKPVFSLPPADGDKDAATE